MRKCEKCGAKRYGYSDGTHVVFICFKCGAFNGMSGGDEEFVEELERNPEILLQMLQNKDFKPIS